MWKTRRDFLRGGAVAGLGALGLGALGPGGALAWDETERSSARRNGRSPQTSRPVVISSANGLRATQRAMEMVTAGADTLDAVVAGVNIVEGDPEDTSVGYGGLPNAAGVVQLDASVIHGPTRGAGAVGALEGFKHPSSVAVKVMQLTDHVFLVGEGARRFALEMGFQEENLLTERARLAWLQWRARLNPEDDYLTPDQSGESVDGFGLRDAWDGKRH
ncbi:MAG TPA: isoaspartyl peptidase/L-asparaginase, partial [Longimicrobiales bacterium]|nr:isoaspartyl peptidase/L-asparaginase [Longimicrobiales bacterium]